jgi:quinol monooxygenase YgiN
MTDEAMRGLRRALGVRGTAIHRAGIRTLHNCRLSVVFRPEADLLRLHGDSNRHTSAETDASPVPVCYRLHSPKVKELDPMAETAFTPAQLNDGFVVAIEIVANAGEEDAIAGALEALIKPTMAEPGVKLFLPYRSPTNPASFFIFELYRNEAGWAEHIRAPAISRHSSRRCCRASPGGSVSLTSLTRLTRSAARGRRVPTPRATFDKLRKYGCNHCHRAQRLGRFASAGAGVPES